VGSLVSNFLGDVASADCRVGESFAGRLLSSRRCLPDVLCILKGLRPVRERNLGLRTVPQGRFAEVAQRWEAYSQYAFRNVLFGPNSIVRRTIRTVRYGTLCTKYASHNPDCDPIPSDSIGISSQYSDS
jgi:hypothetical protein